VSALGAWWRLWRTEPLEVVSPLQLEVAEERLVAALMTRRRWTWPGGDPAPLDVLGRVRRHRVRANALRRGGGNSFVPTVRGRLAPAPSGCRFVGRVGLPPSVRVLLVVWLVGVCCFLLGGLIALGLSVARGQGVRDYPVAVLGPAVMLTVFAGGTWQAGRRAWTDTEPLVDWLRRTLEAR
jgi:hypothetical protein